MHVDTIAWAMNQAVQSEQRAVLAAMALGAAESNNGTTYCGDLARIAAGYLIPLTDVAEAAAKLCELGLIVALPNGRYDLQVGRLAA